MTTISSLITEIRANVSENSDTEEKFYENSEIINYIQRSINDICIDTDTNYFIYSLDVTGSSVGVATSINASSTINITYANHGLVTRDTVYLSGTTGTVSSIIDDTYNIITKVDANNFTIDKDGSDYAWTSSTNIIKMPKEYTFNSISGSSTINLVDLGFLSYRSSDWEEWLYRDLPKVSPKTNVSFTDPTNRKQSCVVYNDTVHLSKGPEIDDKILCAGRWIPTPITTSGDTFPLGAIEEDATIKYVTSMCWLKKNKLETAAGWMGLYQSRKTTIQLKRKRMVETNYPSALTVSKNSNDLYNYVSQFPTEITA